VRRLNAPVRSRGRFPPFRSYSSRFLSVEFRRFLMALSLRPGRNSAIFIHLLPSVSTIFEHIRMRPVRALILDGDGVIWIGGTPLAGAVESLNMIRAMAIRLALVTSDFSTIGISGVTIDDIFTSGHATSVYLKRQGSNQVFVSGFDGLCEKLRINGHDVHTTTHSKVPPVQAVIGVQIIMPN
jgi:hypothetical protein